MSEDERFEAFLRREAADYNAPPAATPRDAMWEAIRAARTQPATVTAIPRRRGWLVAVVGLAATLLIGVAIGRFSARSAVSPATVATTTPVETTQVASVPVDTSADAATTKGGSETSSREPSVTKLPSTSRSIGETIRRFASRTPSEPSQESPRVSVPSGGQPPVNANTSRVSDMVYTVAVLNHLGQAEALLTSYRADNSPELDAQLSKWARGLLSQTRLLMDSPAASDPARRKLLEDLELVLVQMVQLSPASRTEDRKSIDRTIENAHVLTRLRTALPSEASSGT